MPQNKTSKNNQSRVKRSSSGKQSGRIASNHRRRRNVHGKAVQKSLNTEAVVYELGHSRFSPPLYVGKTKRKLGKRLNEHMRNQRSDIGRLLWKIGTDNLQTKILHKVQITPGYEERLGKAEKKYIRKSKPLMNNRVG